MLALFVQTIPPNRALAAAAALLFATHPVQHGGRHGDRGSYRQIPLTHSLDSPATTQAVVGGFVAAAGLCAAFWGRSAAFSPRGRLRALPGRRPGGGGSALRRSNRREERGLVERGETLPSLGLRPPRGLALAKRASSPPQWAMGHALWLPEGSAAELERGERSLSMSSGCDPTPTFRKIDWRWFRTVCGLM